MKYQYQTNTGQILTDENDKIILKTKNQWVMYCNKNFNKLNWKANFIIRENGCCCVNFSNQDF